MGHKRPKLEAKRDESFGQKLRERGQKTSIFHFRFEASASLTIASPYEIYNRFDGATGEINLN
jgi:hypothetical protein